MSFSLLSPGCKFKVHGERLESWCPLCLCGPEVVISLPKGTCSPGSKTRRWMVSSSGLLIAMIIKTISCRFSPNEFDLEYSPTFPFNFPAELPRDCLGRSWNYSSSVLTPCTSACSLRQDPRRPFCNPHNKEYKNWPWLLLDWQRAQQALLSPRGSC